MNTGFGNFLIANDRNAPTSTLPFTDRVKILDTNGVLQTVEYLNFTPNTGNAAYDFSYDAPSSTLAVSDFANRQLYVFRVSAITAAGAPEPASLLLMVSGASAAFATVKYRRKRRLAK